MKRYWLFGGEDYYACGGFHDYRGAFDSVDEAVQDALTRPLFYKQIMRGPVAWFHVFDSETQAIVAKSDFEAFGATKLGECPIAITDLIHYA